MNQENIIDNNKEEFPIVGIGASAGGLEAIEALFANMPSQTNLAFVIVQHLAHEHKSIMDSLLKKYTKMKILHIKDGMKIEKNQIYLNPPDKDIAVINRTFQLIVPAESHEKRFSVDYFLRSLSEDQGKNAICIILSGLGSDGASGLKTIKSAGGMVMVQKRSQARYSAMPGSAIGTGVVDYVLNVEEIPEKLVNYIKHRYVIRHEQRLNKQPHYEDYILKILLFVRSVTGHDFSQYKQSTIKRRIERRIAINQLSNITDYYDLVRKRPEEVEKIYKDLLITLTSFFRDPAVFNVLKEDVIPSLFKQNHPLCPLRIWVPGCATGEEAYSIAMLFLEHMDDEDDFTRIQIFATDLNDDAIEFARKGIYPANIVADVPTEMLGKFFTKEEGGYRVVKQVREMVIFASHNIAKSPPFSKIDLISCRNLLIYMDSTLQKKILKTFHYSLNQNGYLLMGTSESIGEFSETFTSVDLKSNLFQHKTGRHNTSFKYERPIHDPMDFRLKISEKRITETVKAHDIMDKAILSEYAPPCVLVNEGYDVIYSHGSIERYLVVPSGKPSYNVLKMAKECVRYELSVLLHKVVKEGKPVIHEGLKIKQGKELRTYNLIVKPIFDSYYQKELLLIVFDDFVPGIKTNRGEKIILNDKDINPEVVALEQELNSAKQYLLETIKELECSNMERKSAITERLSINEELQSANEELETSQEEMQSANEELQTVNAELQQKIEELSHANNDLNNLLASIETGIIFLDTNLCVKRFTPSVTGLFNLIPSDIGRPIRDITSKVMYENIINEAEEVFDTLKRKDSEVEVIDGRWFSLHILPYRTTENLVDGVVIRFVDITERKRSESVAIQIAKEMDTTLDYITDLVSFHDKDHNILKVNKAYAKFFKSEPEELIGKKCFDVVHCSAKPLSNCPHMQAIEKKGPVTHDYFESRLNVHFEVTALPTINNKGEVANVIYIMKDITKVKERKAICS